MPIFGNTKQVLRSPVVICAAVGLLVRLLALGQSWSANPLVQWPQLDGLIYLSWARDIGAGDWLGEGGFAAGEPFFFNPLYAYLLSPFLARIPEPVGFPLSATHHLIVGRLLAILVVQCCLGAGTSALTALAARRFFSVRAAWIAGLAVACSAALVQLDMHIAVSGLAAFLTAGTVLACAPRPAPAAGSAGGSDEAGSDEGGEPAPPTVGRPVLAGLWLGIGALARPITPLSLPFVAWLFARRSRGGWRSAMIVVAVFAACAVPSLARNWWVSGSPYVYTAAGGINAHLGNNPTARAARTMASSDFRFGPFDMHPTARRFVARETERPLEDVSWDDVSAHFWQRTRRAFVNAPTESSAFYLHKLRWFASAGEPPSSASIVNDREFAPLLRLAFVPTFLLVALGLVGLWVHRSRLEVVLGPGAVVAAHLAVLTLVFPLSHYRSPVIPALAVLAAGALDWGLRAWRSGRPRAFFAAAAGVLAIVVAGALPPQPSAERTSNAMRIATTYRDIALQSGDRGDFARAERWVAEARRVQAEDWPDRPDLPDAWLLDGELAMHQGKYAEAVLDFETAARGQPGNPRVRELLSCAYQKVGRVKDALREARTAVRLAPDAASPLRRLVEVLQALGRGPEATGLLEQLRAIDPRAQPTGGCDAE